jgi:hypothetical protein
MSSATEHVKLRRANSQSGVPVLKNKRAEPDGSSALFALPLQSVTLIPIGGGVCQRRVFRRAGHLRPKREGSILARHVLLGDIGATNAN